MILRHLRARDYRNMPWKNGQGSTLQLAIWPETAIFPSVEFQWRVSAAPVVDSGEFSRFPGCDRLLAVWSGPGFALSHDGGAPVHLKPGAVHAFSGDSVTYCRLGDGGPVRDLGMIYRRDVIQAQMEILTLAAGVQQTQDLAGDFQLWICARGIFEARVRERSFSVTQEESLFAVAPGDGAHGTGSGSRGQVILQAGGWGAEIFSVKLVALT